MSSSLFADGDRLRRVVRIGVVVWLVLIGIEFATGNALAGVAADGLVAAGMLVGGVGYLVFVGTGKPRLAAAAGLIVVGGLLVGYEALVPLDVVEPNATLSSVRFGLVLLAILLYFWERSVD